MAEFGDDVTPEELDIWRVGCRHPGVHARLSMHTCSALAPSNHDSISEEDGIKDHSSCLLHSTIYPMRLRNAEPG